jgi:lipopolysaccharide export LptBFGC system permease protein LptF
MLAGYLRRVLIVASVLLVVGLTIDLWPQIDLITGNKDDGTLRIIWRILRFSALRTPGLMAPVMPFAVFLGVAWTETQHTQTGERMFVWNTGRGPLQCLPPALLLGIVVGVAEIGMDAYLGPAAMAVQMQERLGRDGTRLDRTRAGDVQWIATSAGLLKTEIEYGPPSVLHNLTFFKLDTSGQLVEIDKAKTARLMSDTGQWHLKEGSLWLAEPGTTGDGAEAQTVSPEDAATDRLQPFENRTISLDVAPLWLSVFGMETQYLPISVLRRLAAIDEGQLSKGLFRTRLQVLYGEAFTPGAMALLAASLSILLLPYRVAPRALVGILFTGYLAHSATKACVLMGQNGFISPILAGWFVPTALFCATTVVAFRMFGLRRRDSAAVSNDAAG